MTTQKRTPENPQTRQPATSSARPWATSGPGAAVGYSGDVADIDDAIPTFMSALRRFRARHGLSPLHQRQDPLLDEADLNDLRDSGPERPGLNTDDLAEPNRP